MAKRIAFLFGVSLFFCHQVAAKSCPGAVFTTQVEVDAYISSHLPCDTITGNLIFDGIDIIQILGFNGVKVIQGDLQITNTDISALQHSFGMLEQITGDIRIADNLSLGYVTTCFEDVQEIGGMMVIRDNDALFLVEGFQKLASVGNAIELISNNLLAQIPDFENLTYIGFNLVIRSNGLLTEISGFSKLLEVAADIRIVDNPNLRSILGFAALKKVGNNLSIEDNQVLERIVGFNFVESIGKNLNIEKNDLVSEVVGFLALREIIDDLNLRDNLSLVTIDAFDNLAFVGADIEIINNDKLVEIVGFSKLKKIYGLDIEFNPMLQMIAGFSYLDSICGDINIDNNVKLVSVSGFGALKVIEGTLNVVDNNSLNKISTFHSLKSIGSNFIIEDNYLSELLGFGNLSSVGQLFSIRNESQLISISSFPKLQSIVGPFLIFNNALLKEISGFNKLVSVTNNFFIDFNPSLKHISGFKALATVTFDLFIRNNDQLLHIKGFENLLNVGDDLGILDNPLLESIFAFENLQSVDELLLSTNPSLFYCCGLANVLMIAGYNSLNIGGNSPGCNTAVEILAICDAALSNCNPNCLGQLNAAIDRHGVAILRPSDFILDTMECSSGLEIWVENKWGGTIFGPQLIGMNGAFPIKACQYLNQLPLKLVARSTTGTCWTDLTFKEYRIPTVPSDPTITVLCTDPIVKGPLPGSKRPAWIPCVPESEATYVTDWITTFDCEPGVSDTVKVIYREWEAFGKNGERGVAFDTIYVLQFPEITADNIYCEAKDSLYCADTLAEIGPYITYLDPTNGCQETWLVNVEDKDQDGMLEFTPRIFDPLCGLTVFVDYTKFPGNCEINYRVKVEIKQECYGLPSTCTVPVPAGTLPNVAQQLGPGYWRCEFWVVDLDTLAPITYCKGKELFTGPFAAENFEFFSDFLAGGIEEIAPANALVENTNKSNVDLSALPYVLTINSVHSGEFSDEFDLQSTKENQPEIVQNEFFPFPYYANSVISYTAEGNVDFNFLWDFSLAPIQDDFFFPNRVIESAQFPNGSSAAAVSIFYSINGQSFRIIEGESFEEKYLGGTFARALPAIAALPSVIEPVAIGESKSGTLNIPLKAGDNLYIVAIWDSPSDATFRIMGQNIVSTSNEDCVAHAYVPPLYAADDWSGIKSVKATIEDIGTVVLTLDPADTCWITHDRLKLPKREDPYKVIYEIFDSCHNMTFDSCYLIAKDLVRPVPVVEKGLTVNLTDKKVWLDAASFNEGSTDNCGINYLFVRRADWYESCIDLCDSLVPLCITDHHDTLFLPYLNPDKRLNEVEAHYAQIMGWLKNEGEVCHELIYNAWQYDLIKYANRLCKEHPYKFDDALLKQLITECVARYEFNNIFEPVPTHLNSPTFFHTDDSNLLDQYAQLGGGWSDAVPFDCDDACGAVTVEILVMDYWCNWSLAWTTVWVEDKTEIKIAKNVDEEVNISCKSYRESRFSYGEQTHPVSIEYIVAKAKQGEEAAYQSMNEIFGGYAKAWIDPYGRYVDVNGDSIVCDFDFSDSTCICTSYTEPVRIYDEHEGYIWIDSLITECYYESDTLNLTNGVVVTNCAQNVHCKQEVWCNIDHCGEGYVYRKFKIWSDCDFSALDTSGLTHEDIARIDSAQHVADTLIREQRIWIGNECKLSKYMFDVPPDTIITACQISYDAHGNIEGLAGPESTGEAKYRFDDDCRLVGIAHNDRVFKIVGGEEGCYKILRTWYFADWCSHGEPTISTWWKDYELVLDSCLQTIIIQDTLAPNCTITGPVTSGNILEVGTCDYNLVVTVSAEDACGLNEYNWELVNIKDFEPFVFKNGSGQLTGDAANEFNLTFTSLPHGIYKLKVELVDECNNEGYCEYLIDIVAVKKPTALCITSLTTRLTPWDIDQDGVTDTALSIIWAEEFDVSSLPACQDSAIEYRIELLDGVGDDFPAGDADSLLVGCDQFGSNLVRLWVRSLPSMTTDYCDVVLIVQSDFAGCNRVGGESEGLRVIEVDHQYTGKLSLTHADEGMSIVQGIGGRPEGQAATAEAFHLEQNVPNPFAQETVIGFVIPQDMKATLSIYTIDGKLLKSYSGNYAKGYHTQSILRDELEMAGILYYQLQAGSFIATRKLLCMP